MMFRCQVTNADEKHAVDSRMRWSQTKYLSAGISPVLAHLLSLAGHARPGPRASLRAAGEVSPNRSGDGRLGRRLHRAGGHPIPVRQQAVRVASPCPEVQVEAVAHAVSIRLRLIVHQVAVH